MLVGTVNNQSQLSTALNADNEIQTQPFIVEVDDYKASLENNIDGMNALTYVAGYLLRKVLAKHQCTICKQELSSNELDNSSKLLCLFKAYEISKEKPFGGLVVPSDSFIEYVKNIDK
jgi:hypothetical protein